MFLAQEPETLADRSAVLEPEPAGTDKTDKSSPGPLLAVLSGPEEEGSENLPATSMGPLVDAAAACVGCGRADWVVSVVMDDGTRLCGRCR
jgi:hypothetical protein